jgi:hypothetical protein
LTLIRKALWPSAIAIGFLVFLGAIGSGTAGTARAAVGDDGDICLIEGPTLIQVDETVAYAARIQDNDEEDQEFNVSIDNISGQSFITSVVDGNYFEGTFEDDHEEIDPTTSVFDLENWTLDGAEDDLLEDLANDYGYEPEENVCGDSEEDILDDLVDSIFSDVFQLILDGIEAGEICTAPVGQTATCVGTDADGIDDLDIDCDVTATGGTCSVPGQVNEAAIATELAEAIVSEGGFPDCTALGNFAEDLATNTAGSATAFVGFQFNDYINDICVAGDLDFDGIILGGDDLVVVDVTCEEAGEFEITFANVDEDDDTLSLDVQCVGEVDEGIITATPNKVEIVPALGSVSYSLIVVELLDEDGEPALGGSVDFSTNRCEFLDEDGLTEEEFVAIADLFDDLHVNDAASAQAIEDATLDEDDPDDVSNDVASFTLDDDAGAFDEGDTLAAIILDCSDPGTTPGVAAVSFQVDQEGADVVGSINVTVVGPPASITVTASPDTLRCGEKATVTISVKDTAGQAVSPHTKVEVITNAGGVLAGTGAVAGLAGPVVPISSTVAETDASGNTTVFLLTSEQHSGAYEVVATSGGSGAVTSVLGGLFSTQPVSAQDTVTCSLAAAAAPAPTVTAPRTGQGITPPSTGDAGLVDSSSSTSWVLVLGGVAAFALLSVATVKVARR